MDKEAGRSRERNARVTMKAFGVLADTDPVPIAP
jgi:hypothetical protein